MKYTCMRNNHIPNFDVIRVLQWKNRYIPSNEKIISNPIVIMQLNVVGIWRKINLAIYKNNQCNRASKN